MTLKDYLDRHELTNIGFARKSGVDTTKISKFANGHARPSLDNAYKIFKASQGKVKLDDWFKEENDGKEL